MPENPSYRNYSTYQQPAFEADELDETTLDQVRGGLSSPAQLQNGINPDGWVTEMPTQTFNLFKNKKVSNR